MKRIEFLALASLAAMGFAGATAAQAQNWPHDRYDRDRAERRWDRHERWERHHGWNRGHGDRDHPRCWTERRHGRRVEVCTR